jgi:hypothetical protein
MVLVVANLSAAPLTGVSLASAAHAVPAGSWAPRNLLGGADAAPLRVGGDGQLRGYRPLPTLAPAEGYLFELTASPSRSKRR